MKLPRLTSAFILATVLFVVRPAAASSIIDVTGSTLGCFGAGCSTFTDPAVSSATYGLTFTGSALDVDTDVTGSATNIDLGTLARGNVNVSSTTAALSFTLEVIFTLPTGITGGQQETFSAFITGKNLGGGGPLAVDFDNTWQTLTYTNAFGSGSFDFSVINNPEVQKNHSASILGGIRDATFTPTAAVPEPATIVLLGIGVAAGAWRRRCQPVRH